MVSSNFEALRIWLAYIIDLKTPALISLTLKKDIEEIILFVYLFR